LLWRPDREVLLWLKVLVEEAEYLLSWEDGSLSQEDEGELPPPTDLQTLLVLGIILSPAPGCLANAFWAVSGVG
jgi:hypothetical protein